MKINDFYKISETSQKYHYAKYLLNEQKLTDVEYNEAYSQFGSYNLNSIYLKFLAYLIN